MIPIGRDLSDIHPNVIRWIGNNNPPKDILDSISESVWYKTDTVERRLAKDLAEGRVRYDRIYSADPDYKPPKNLEKKQPRGILSKGIMGFVSMIGRIGSGLFDMGKWAISFFYKA